MTDYQQAVDEIRFSMQSDVWEATDELRQAAAVYAEACAEVNARLRRCDQYLSRGLRSEAIHLAEAEPNLLECLAALDFPEREDWLQAVAVYDLPTPEALLVDVADDLNEAYVTEQPLQRLLDQHRLLAWKRAPLVQRLAVMRKLADLDEESPFWDEDIRTFEKQRLREIESEARQAARRGDAATLKALAEELHRTPWREAPPASVTKAVRQLAGQLDRKTACDELQELADSLERAIGELDLAGARKLRTRWNEVISRARPSQDDPLVERVSPILAWIADEDAAEAAERGFAAAVAELERSLDAGESLSELERKTHAALKFERDLPESLVVRLDHRLSSLRLAETRLKRLQVGAVAAVLLGIAVFVGVLIQRQQAARELDRIAKAVEKLLDEGELTEARALLQEQQAHASSERMLALQTRLDSLETAERERKTEFAAAIETARDAREYEQALASLTTARPLARTADEKLAVNSLEQTWENRHREQIAEIERQFRTSVDEVSANLQRLTDVIQEQPAGPEAAELLTETLARLSTLATQADGLRPELGNEVKLLTARHQQLSELRETLARQYNTRQQVTARALVAPGTDNPSRKIAEYVAALEEHADSLGRVPAAEHMRAAASESRFWCGVLEWERVVSKWDQIEPRDAAEAAARLDVCQRFLKTHAGCPIHEEIEEYVSYLKAIRGRDDPDSGPKLRLGRIFAHHLIGDAWCLEHKDGRHFYLADKVEFNRDEKTIRYYIGYQQDEADIKTLLVNVNDLTDRNPQRPPQYAIAQLVERRLSKLPIAEWDDFFLELTRSIEETSDLDAFLKFDLLKRSLEFAAAGDPFLKHGLKAHLQLLSDAAINPAVRWMNPDSAEAKQAREAAAKVLGGLPPLEPAWSAAREARLEFSGRFRQRPMMIGWLAQNDGAWECRTSWQPTSEHVLQVVLADEKKSRSQWHQVGTAEDELTIHASQAEYLLEGRPVFAIPVDRSRAITQSTQPLPQR